MTGQLEATLAEKLGEAWRRPGDERTVSSRKARSSGSSPAASADLHAHQLDRSRSRELLDAVLGDGVGATDEHPQRCRLVEEAGVEDER